jgi:hypothetical protein
MPTKNQPLLAHRSLIALSKVKDPKLLCMTAERIAMNVIECTLKECIRDGGIISGDYYTCTVVRRELSDPIADSLHVDDYKYNEGRFMWEEISEQLGIDDDNCELVINVNFNGRHNETFHYGGCASVDDFICDWEETFRACGISTNTDPESFAITTSTISKWAYRIMDRLRDCVAGRAIEEGGEEM